MPLYFSAHTTACLTKQALRELMKDLLASTEVDVRRCAASQLAGRMIIEIEAPDQSALESWLKEHHLNTEWIMRVELEGSDASLREF